MILVSDIFADSYQASSQYLLLRDFYNNKIFTVKNTAMTPRQIQTLDSDNLLGKQRKDEKKWRKFSLKELVYLLIVADLKSFGLEHNQLRGLWNTFFNENTHISEAHVDTKLVSEMAIGCTLLGAEIILTIKDNGEVGFFDSSHYVALGYRKPHIQLIFNDYVKKVLEFTGKKMPQVNWSLYSEYFKLSIKEEDLLKIIRDGSYKNITVKKKNGEIELVSAEKIDNNELSPEKLLKLIKDKDFQDISIVKRDGKIVNLKVEETYKL